MSSWINREGRRINKARLLIQPAVEGEAGIWADLGCGDGVFTYLLCTYLQPNSEIYAVDKKRFSLRSLQRNLAESCTQSAVNPHRADFSQALDLPPLDGLVMANSLHFVKWKKALLAQLVRLLKPGGKLVIVEYNATRGNLAVPHPIDEASFLRLAAEVGLREPQIVSKAPSSFLGEMYTGTALAA